MKKGTVITLHVLSFILIGGLATGLTLMYFDNQDQFEKYDKRIEDLEEKNKTLSNSFSRYEETLSNNETNNTQTNQEEKYDISSFDKIKASDIARLSKKETIVVMIGREGCGWCQKYISVLKSAQKKYNFTTKYIDQSTILSPQTWALIDEEAYNTLISIPADSGYENFLSEEFGATPLTLIIKDNKIINAFAGYTEESYLSSILESSGFTK